MSSAEPSRLVKSAAEAGTDRAEDASVSIDVTLAVPERFRPGFDSWSHHPRRLLAYGVYAAEALDGLVPPLAKKGLSAMSILYVFATTADRSRRAEQFQMHPAMRAYMARRTAFENVVREWSSSVTLPAIMAGAVMAGARALLAARAPGAAAALDSRLLRYGPATAAAALSPLALAASSELTERVVMGWAVKPTLDAWMPPPIIESATDDSLPPWPIDGVSMQTVGELAASAAAAAAEDKPSGPVDASGGGAHSAIETPSILSPDEQAEAAAISDDVVSAVLAGFSFGGDELSQRRLAWALDGKADTPFPMSPEEEAIMERHRVQSDPGELAPKLR